MRRLEYLNELKSYYTVIGEDENDKGQLFYVCAVKNEEDYTVIILKDMNRLQHPSKLSIITEYNIDDKSKKNLKIADIITVEKNIGNGSLLMKYLFQYANENKNIKKITGTLSELDKDHFDRLEYFYKKHGFNVVFRTNNQGERIKGYIEKKL